MKQFSLKIKILAFVLAIAFTFQSLYSINSHTYSTGFENFHEDCDFSCFPSNNLSHFSYDCGQSFHIY
ncbi:hypothetical protein [Olleya sp. R77988]|uniref:hypothetical protein n=1 Tax=Olleya sp. R77988 TaxID=3093875 RepID=UPI0037C5C9B0